MIEPTETESKESLDEFILAMKTILKEAEEDPEKLTDAPFNTPVRRLDEVRAARQLVLRWEKKEDEKMRSWEDEKNYKMQNTNYKQITNYNVQNYKQKISKKLL